jgi:hypothetical protein
MPNERQDKKRNCAGRTDERRRFIDQVYAEEAELLFFLVGDDGVVFFVVAFGFYRGELQRIAGDDFEVDTTLIALEDFAFVYIVRVDIKRTIAFWANNSHAGTLQ